MKRFRLSRNAARDLEELFLYWAQRAGPDTADRLVDAIIERFWTLGQYPDSGRPCDDIEPGVKCFPAGKYLIYYRKVRRGVEIAHIFHSAREQKEAWQQSPPR